MCGNDSFFHIHNPCSATYRHQHICQGVFFRQQLQVEMITIPLFFYLLQTPPGLASSSGCPTPTSSACPSCTGWPTWPRSAPSSPPWPSAWRGTSPSASRCGSGEETRFFRACAFPPAKWDDYVQYDPTIYCTWSWLVPVSYYFHLPLLKLDEQNETKSRFKPTVGILPSKEDRETKSMFHEQSHSLLTAHAVLPTPAAKLYFVFPR